MRRPTAWGNLIEYFRSNGMQSQIRRRRSGTARLESLERRDLLTNGLHADLSVTASAPASVLSGDLMAYDITVANHGPDAAFNVVLTDLSPAETGFFSFEPATQPNPFMFTGYGQGQSGPFTSTIMAIPPGASAEMKIFVRVANGLSDGAVITNSVQVSADSTDPTPSDDTASSTTMVHPPAVFISGSVYFDANADGVRQPSEPGAVAAGDPFIDLNNNGTLDPGEPSCPPVNGYYQFALGAPGSYTVRESTTPRRDFTVTGPAGGSYTVTGAQGSSFTGLDFGETPINAVIPIEPVANRFAPAHDADAAFVTGLYRNILQRDPDPAGVDFWSRAIAGGAGRSVIVHALWESAEHRSLEVDNYYETYLHRPADDAGRGFWVAALEATSDEEAVITAIVSGGEFRAAHPSNEQFVEALYDAIFMRPSDPEGVKYWASQLQNGVSRPSVAESLLRSGASIQPFISSLFAGYLHRGPDPSGATFLTFRLANNLASLEDCVIFVLASDEYFASAQAAAH